MNGKNGTLVLLASSIFLGLPGVLVLTWGALAALVSFLPGAEVDIAGSTRPIAGFIAGLLALAVGALLVWIPVRMWQRKAHHTSG